MWECDFTKNRGTEEQRNRRTEEPESQEPKKEYIKKTKEEE